MNGMNCWAAWSEEQYNAPSAIWYRLNGKRMPKILFRLYRRGKNRCIKCGRRLKSDGRCEARKWVEV